MPQAKVRHGLISYLTIDKETDREYEDRAFRGMTVNLSQKEYDRLLSHGAIIPADEELDQPGRLLALPAGASNEEILNWAMAAKDSEIVAAVAERPELADRLRDAHEEVKRRVQQYNEHLGGVLKAADEVAEEAIKARQAAEEDLIGTGGSDGGTGETTTPPAPSGDGGISPATGGTPPPPVANTDGTVTEDIRSFDLVVQGSNRDIENYLGEHPEHAQQILDAETRRAETARAAGDQEARVRSGVVKAVEVAVQHAS